MKHTSQNLSKWAAQLLSFTTAIFTTATLTGMGVAHAADACKDITIPCRHFIYVADAKFQKLSGSRILLGDITLPPDAATDASLTNKYFVISSKDLTPDTLIGGRDISAILQPIPTKCSRVNVSVIIFDLDSSILPPGDFSIPIPFFGVKSDGHPDLAAEASHVEGRIRRPKIEANFQSSGSNRLELKLTNTGNAKAFPFAFDEAPDELPLRVIDNRCQAQSLKPGEACSIEIEQKVESVVSDRGVSWSVPFDQSKSYLWLTIYRERNSLKAHALIK